ncbi:uncharacterized protein LOC121785264 [Salvia splendens]|uniref:uncharacterized protein LOC121785264 n=1 Tax=Salvia splendens TaxID=180675 RepID=UPI001C25FF39|nr:uncharacterized protein LOC121785264 [Salvia splendens]
MASVMKKLKKKVMKPIKRLKKIFNRWKSKRVYYSSDSDSDSSSDSSSSWASDGSISATSVLGINVGPERRNMNIPYGYLALPVFQALIEQGNNMFGHLTPQAYTLPCESILVSNILTLLDRDEERFRDYSLDDFIVHCFESPNWPHV